MTAKRFLLDFEVEAHGCLVEELRTVTSHHPLGDLEVHITNLAVAPGTDRPLLSVQIIVPGDDIRGVERPGREALKQYLHYLTFVTNLKFRLRPERPQAGGLVRRVGPVELGGGGRNGGGG